MSAKAFITLPKRNLVSVQNHLMIKLEASVAHSFHTSVHSFEVEIVDSVPFIREATLGLPLEASHLVLASLNQRD